MSLFKVNYRDAAPSGDVIGRACLMARGDEEIESVRQFWPREVARG